MEVFNKLTPAEIERLAILAEECSEVVQIIGKILRHGYESYNPKDPAKKSNRELLEEELGDVDFASFLMCESGDLNRDQITEMMRLKNLKIGPYLHHQKST